MLAENGVYDDVVINSKLDRLTEKDIAHMVNTLNQRYR